MINADVNLSLKGIKEVAWLPKYLNDKVKHLHRVVEHAHCTKSLQLDINVDQTAIGSRPKNRTCVNCNKYKN